MRADNLLMSPVLSSYQKFRFTFCLIDKSLNDLAALYA